MDIVEKARVFATAAHAAVKQKRKYTGEDYIVHPAAVVELLKVNKSPPTAEMLAAAWLHDVVEDTGVPISVIFTEFGPVVGKLVHELTDVSKPEDGNRKIRKEKDRQHLANASKEAKTIKACDLMDNTVSIILYDMDFARVYVKEKRAMIGVMNELDHDVMFALSKVLEAAESMIALNDIQRGLKNV